MCGILLLLRILKSDNFPYFKLIHRKLFSVLTGIYISIPKQKEEEWKQHWEEEPERVFGDGLEIVGTKFLNVSTALLVGFVVRNFIR